MGPTSLFAAVPIVGAAIEFRDSSLSAQRDKENNHPREDERTKSLVAGAASRALVTADVIRVVVAAQDFRADVFLNAFDNRAGKRVSPQ
jgi:hypothetical protein